VHDNVLNIDFRDATVIFVYLVPEGMSMLSDRLSSAIDNGARLVSYGKSILFIFVIL
jgi:hypothetical protein